MEPVESIKCDNDLKFPSLFLEHIRCSTSVISPSLEMNALSRDPDIPHLLSEASLTISFYSELLWHLKHGQGRIGLSESEKVKARETLSLQSSFINDAKN